MEHGLLNELLSSIIEFKRNALGLLFEQQVRDQTNEEEMLETKSSLSAEEDEEEMLPSGEGVPTPGQFREGSGVSSGTGVLMSGGGADTKTSEKGIGGRRTSEEEQHLFATPKVKSGGGAAAMEEELKEVGAGGTNLADVSSTITDVSMNEDDTKGGDDKKPGTTGGRKSARGGRRTGSTGERRAREHDAIHAIKTNLFYGLSYLEELQERLNFIKFLLVNSEISYKQEHLSVLWESLVVNSFHEKERDMFFKWCQNTKNNKEEHIMDEECLETFFFETLLCLDFRFISETIYECFETFFVY